MGIGDNELGDNGVGDNGVGDRPLGDNDTKSFFQFLVYFTQQIIQQKSEFALRN